MAKEPIIIICWLRQLARRVQEELESEILKDGEEECC